MSTIERSRTRCLPPHRAALVALVLVMAVTSVAEAQDAAVIVNRKVDVTTLPLVFLDKILHYEKQFLPGRKPIDLLVIPPAGWQLEDGGPSEAERARAQAVRRVIVETIFGGDQRYFQHWQGSNKLHKPKEMYASAAVETVQRNPRALAVVDADSPLPEDVVVLRIDGLLPGDEEYGLRGLGQKGRR